MAIPEVKVVVFARFCDARGYFTETFRKRDLRDHPGSDGLRGLEFVQGNESFSKAGAVRGLHFQWNPFMGKLVRTLRGRMIDLVLDIRKDRPTYGKILAWDMPYHEDSDQDEWIWVPPGFAHGNLFMEPTQIQYLCTGEYSAGCEAGISPLAPDIDWSLCPAELKGLFDAVARGSELISEKDRAGLTVSGWQNDPRSDQFTAPRLGMAKAGI
ncbi:MAG: dTDP-4-dehydrorhamnose 3,5-epimerase family protein [Elusimicrobia bacterium]|nr:dTDP-4-dehydrorhamnose 3,5-epimerase family protein [Elusimicrobiota bacterium]